jgi:predicted nuclease with TOPRIM domain
MEKFSKEDLEKILSDLDIEYSKIGDRMSEIRKELGELENKKRDTDNKMYLLKNAIDFFRLECI